VGGFPKGFEFLVMELQRSFGPVIIGWSNLTNYRRLGSLHRRHELRFDSSVTEHPLEPRARVHSPKGQWLSKLIAFIAALAEMFGWNVEIAATE